MIYIIIFMIISAFCTLYLIAPIFETHKKTCYFLMVFIPASAAGIYIISAPDLIFPKSTVIYEKTKKEKLATQLENLKGDVNLTLKLADIYISEGKEDNAIELLAGVMKEYSDNQEIKLALGKAYFSKGLLYADRGENDNALEYLQKAYDVSPKNASFLGDLEHFIDIITNSK